MPKKTELSKEETREYITFLRSKKVKNGDIAEYCDVHPVTVSFWKSQKHTNGGNAKLKQMAEEWGFSK